MPVSAATKLTPGWLVAKKEMNGEVVDRYFELALREGNRQALIQRIEQLEPGKYIDQLALISQPTLIIWGGQDRLIPVVNANNFKRDIPGSQLVIFDKLGHVPQEEAPEQTVIALKAFLNIR